MGMAIGPNYIASDSGTASWGWRHDSISTDTDLWTYHSDGNVTITQRGSVPFNFNSGAYLGMSGKAGVDYRNNGWTPNTIYGNNMQLNICANRAANGGSAFFGLNGGFQDQLTLGVDASLAYCYPANTTALSFPN